jgi:putative ABC transport system permease protein
MRWLKQILVLSRLNVFTIPQRLASGMVTIVGVACVVGVFIAVLSMAAGLEYAISSVGSEENVIVLGRGAVTELNSNISTENERIIADTPGVRKGSDGTPLSSPELYITVPVAGGPVTLRGTTLGGLQVRTKVKILEGRLFREGTNEIILGRQIAKALQDAPVGRTLDIGDSSWQIVGVFEDSGSVAESEIWCDVRVLQQRFRREGVYQSIRLSLDPELAIEDFQARLDQDPRLRVVVQNERDYYTSQSSNMTSFIRAIGYPLAIIMGFGAIIAVINTMYASVSARTVEIATLRALGYLPFSVGISTLLESMVLAVAGGALGAIAVYFALNGYSISAFSSESVSQVVFGFTVTSELMVQGLTAALVIGFLGGLFPAIRASRLPIVAGLRED